MQLRIETDQHCLRIQHYGELGFQERSVVDLIKFARKLPQVKMESEDRAVWIQVQGSPKSPPTRLEVQNIKTRVRIYFLESDSTKSILCLASKSRPGKIAPGYAGRFHLPAMRCGAA
jgi:hypothetical protein